MHANMFVPLCAHMLCLAPVCMCVVFMCVCVYVYICMHMSAQIPKVKCQLIHMNSEVWQTVMKRGYLSVTILGFAFPHIAQCVFFVCTCTVCVCERYALIRSCQQAHGSCLRLYELVGADVNLYEHICIRILYICSSATGPHKIGLEESGRAMIHPLLSKHRSERGNLHSGVYVHLWVLRGTVHIFHLYLCPCSVSVRPTAFNGVWPHIWLAELISVTVRLCVAGMRK